MTACRPNITAMARGQPDGMGSAAEAGCIAALWAGPPKRKVAATRITNAPVLRAAVKSCALLPQRMPRHCRTPKPTTMETESILTFCGPARMEKRRPLYSLMTMATAAAVPQVESQSLQPTMKPAYSPKARREKLYWPPLRGIAAPSSAMEDAPERA